MFQLQLQGSRNYMRRIRKNILGHIWTLFQSVLENNKGDRRVSARSSDLEGSRPKNIKKHFVFYKKSGFLINKYFLCFSPLEPSRSLDLAETHRSPFLSSQTDTKSVQLWPRDFFELVVQLPGEDCFS